MSLEKRIVRRCKKLEAAKDADARMPKEKTADQTMLDEESSHGA